MQFKMPFRGGTAQRKAWLLGWASSQRGGDDNESIPRWVPGFVFLGPLPGQPWWLFNLDAAYHANMLYIVGSIIYVAQALYYEQSFHLSPFDDDYNPQNPSNYLNLVGAALFMANALVAMLDWWLSKRSASIFNAVVLPLALPARGGPLPEADRNSSSISDKISPPTRASFTVPVRGESPPDVDIIPPPTFIHIELEEMNKRVLDLYFWNNIFFLLAAITFQMDGTWQYNSRLDGLNCMGGICGSLLMPLFGNVFYLLSSLCSVAEYFENAKIRQGQGLPPLSLFRPTGDEPIDYFGWGDWLFLVAAVIPCIQSFWQYYYPFESPAAANNAIAPWYLVNQIVWLVDSLAYQIGYWLFMRNLLSSARKQAQARGGGAGGGGGGLMHGVNAEQQLQDTISPIVARASNSTSTYAEGDSKILEGGSHSVELYSQSHP